MGYYAKDWCRAVVLDWEKKNPRVHLAVAKFTSWASVLKVQNPREFVIGRMVFHLQRAKTQNVWRMIKLFIEKEIQWKYIFSEFLLLRDQRESMSNWWANNLPFKEEEFSPSAKSPIDVQLSTGYDEAQAGFPGVSGGKAALEAAFPRESPPKEVE